MTEISEGSVGPVDAHLDVVDGRVSISGKGDASVYAKRPRTEPLDVSQTHLRLRVVGEGINARIDLNGAQLDALEGLIHDVQDAYQQTEYPTEVDLE